MPVYLEHPVRMAWSHGAAVWSFDAATWGVCVQGRTVEEALGSWADRFGGAEVVEVVEGDEQAFRRDFRPASDTEMEHTLSALGRQRKRALAVLHDQPDEILDFDDPDRRLPDWASWRTVRQVLWHVCDTESRYYLPQTGLPGRERREDLAEELAASAAHVRAVLATMPRALVNRTGGEVWTSTKLLRRLAWHEAGELDAVDELLARWRRRR